MVGILREVVEYSIGKGRGKVKLIIAGGRKYTFTEDDIKFLDTLVQDITEVVSGGAKGADKCGELWAKGNDLPVKKFEAQWAMYGRSAGPRRNTQMANYADAVVLFDGGRGTTNMYETALKHGLEIYDRRK